MCTLIIRVAVFDAVTSLICCCFASVLVVVYTGLLMQYKKITVTIVSVNKMSDEMLLEPKGNLMRVGACVFSALLVVGFIAKSTLPCSGII